MAGIIDQNVREIETQIKNRQLAATVAANLLSVGYELSAKDMALSQQCDENRRFKPAVE